jgi:hypothetical protein
VKRSQGSGEITGVLFALAFAICFVVLIVWVADQPSRHHVKKYVTKDHRVYLHEQNGMWFEFIVPDTGNSQPYWVRVAVGPRPEEIEEEENAVIEEEANGEPEGEATDTGSDTGNGDTGDTGGDSGGDGGDGGDGGGE